MQHHYISGHVFETTQRLSDIRVLNTVNAVEHEIRHYKLNYAEYLPDDHIQTSKLETVEACVIDTCLPPTLFNWLGFTEGQATTSTQSITLPDTYRLLDYRFADFNGDGKQELAKLYVTNDGSAHYLRYSTSLNNGLRAEYFADGNIQMLIPDDIATDPSRPNAGMRVLDYNADGRSDLAYYSRDAGEWKILISQPVTAGNPEDIGWRLTDLGVTLAADHSLSFVDIDGDGLADALYLEDDQVIVQRMVAGGSELISPTFYEFAARETYALEVPVIENGTVFVTDIDGGAGDLNGDGANNFMVRFNRRCNITVPRDQDPFACESGYFYRAYSLQNGLLSRIGNGFEMDVGTGGVTADPLELLPTISIADINGDGLGDLTYTLVNTLLPEIPITAVRHWLNNGKEFIQGNSISISDGLDGRQHPQFVDYDLDGDLDIIYAQDRKLCCCAGITRLAPTRP